jgi:type IV secretory pathway VirB10-like protein
MARPNPITNTLASESGRSFTRLPSDRWARVRCEPIPAAARVLAFAFLLCLGSAPAWTQQKGQSPQPQDPQQQNENQQSQPKDQQQQKKSQQPQPKNQPQQPKGRPEQPSDKQQMRGLDEQIQEIKSDVLRITAELNGLEEKLLYPSGTQVAVFVALAKGDTMRLDAVRLQIDGQLVAHYIYSAKELEALHKGGVQRIYVGNVATGDHQLEVLVDGKLQAGEDFSRTERFAFRKEVKPKMVGLTVASSGKTPITLGEW